MKKLVSLILALAMLLSVGMIAQADEPTKIVWWVYGSDAPIDTQLVVEAANKYSAEKIGVVVELLFKDESGFDRDMQVGEYYDMTFTCDWANDFASNAINGMFMDITELVKKETPPCTSASMRSTGTLPVLWTA